MVGFRKRLSPIVAVAFALTLVSAAIPPASSAQDDTVTVYLQPWDATAGTVISQMCLSLAGASNVGCDENGDGYIAFQDMHPGTYTVVQETIIAGIVQLGGDTTITVADSPAEQYFTIEFHTMDQGATTPAPTVAPTMAAPTASASQSSGSPSAATSLPNTGAGTGAGVTASGPLGLASLVLLAIASLAAFGGGLLWWSRRHA